MPTKTPRKPIVPVVCGEPAEDGQNCNLPKDHEGEHTFVSPLREEVNEPSEETPEEAAQRLFGDDIVVRPVIAALARIMGGLPTLEAIGENKHFGYKFIKDTQISGAVRPKMAKEGLMVIPEVLEESWVETSTKNGGKSYVTKMKIRFTVIHAASGDEVSGVGFGYGDDSGDKGANKAFTAAMKYWLMKLFQIGGEDNEDDQRADLRAANREAGSISDAVGVRIEDSNVQGIARGGKSDKMTMTQKKQIQALYKDLELTPETFGERIDKILGDKLAFEEGGDATAILNSYLNKLQADDAGTLLNGLVDEKDTREHDAAQNAGVAPGQPDEGELPGYGD